MFSKFGNFLYDIIVKDEKGAQVKKKNMKLVMICNKTTYFLFRDGNYKLFLYKLNSDDKDQFFFQIVREVKDHMLPYYELENPEEDYVDELDYFRLYYIRYEGDVY